MRKTFCVFFPRNRLLHFVKINFRSFCFTKTCQSGLATFRYVSNGWKRSEQLQQNCQSQLWIFIWRLENPHLNVQCDKIERFLEFLGSSIYCPSNPNVWWLFGQFRKPLLFKSNWRAHFWGKFLEKFGLLLFQHLVTLLGRSVYVMLFRQLVVH